MKKKESTYYGVISEFYSDGTVKACIIDRITNERPKSQHRKTSIADFYVDWFPTLAEAEGHLQLARVA
ncbi:MAG: hypothetical protein FWH12_02160 [Treponema sp.]|nr:hypothetical protein [Treponema sp.]